MHITTKKSTRILFAPLIAFCNWLGESHPVIMVKLRYFARFKKMPDFKTPKTMNETSPERYEGMIDKLIRDLRDV